MNRSRIQAIVALIGVLILMTMLTPPIVQADFGSNWAGQFFGNTTFSGAVIATASYPSGINVNWPGQPTDGLNVPVPGVAADNFSVQFSSVQNFAAPGTYTFTVFVDDGVRVIIDSVMVLDKLTGAAGQTFSFSQSMTAGSHSFVLQFVEVGGPAFLQFQWNLSSTGQITPIVTLTTTPATTATVVTVRGLSVRTGPYLGATLIAVARPGNAYAVNGKSTDEGGAYTWYLLTVGEHTGWSSGRYLQLNGDPNAIPRVGNVFETLDGAPNTGAKAFPRAIMNIRRRPSIRSQLLGKMPWGGEGELLNRTVRGGLNYWLQVRYNGVVGWIFAPFVTVKGPVDAVPIR